MVVLTVAVYILQSLILIVPARAQTTGLERSGRWLMYNNSYPYLVGYDLQQLFSQKSYSYADIDYKLNQLQEFRINKIRVWINAWFLGINGYYPWIVDANGKKNLDVWNVTYWTRMRDFVQKCKDRDIIVEFTLFTPYPIESASDSWWKNTAWQVAWNKIFNLNNAFSTNANGHFFPQFFDLNYSERSSSNKTLKDYQKALIDKTIDELNGFGNVYFELANEFPGVWTNDGSAINQVYPWQQYWANYMHTTKGVITTCHANEGSGQNTFGIQYFKDTAYCDILNFHFRTGETRKDNANIVSNFFHNLQTSNKILQCNESKAYEDLTYTDMVTREAWGTFVSGGYYFHYNDSTDIIGTYDWRNLAERLKILRNIAESVNFWQMSPVDENVNEYDSLITQAPSRYWQLLANPGKEYVAYFNQNPTTNDVRINLPAGNYNYVFYDTRLWNQNGLKSGMAISAGGQTSIPVPLASAWNGNTGLVLVIMKQETDLMPPAAPTCLTVN